MEHAEKDFGIGGLQVKAPNHAAEFFFGGDSGARFDVAARLQGLEQGGSDALDGLHFSSFRFCNGGRRGRLTRQFIEANGDGLAEIHGLMLFANGNVQEPVAMAQIVVREAPLLRAKKKRDAPIQRVPAEFRGRLVQEVQRMLQFAIADRRSADNQGAIGDRFGDVIEFFRFRQDF